MLFSPLRSLPHFIDLIDFTVHSVFLEAGVTAIKSLLKRIELLKDCSVLKILFCLLSSLWVRQCVKECFSHQPKLKFKEKESIWQMAVLATRSHNVASIFSYLYKRTVFSFCVVCVCPCSRVCTNVGSRLTLFISIGQSLSESGVHPFQQVLLASYPRVPLCLQVLDYRWQPRQPGFKGVLGIQTLVLRLVWQAFDPLRHLPRL